MKKIMFSDRFCLTEAVLAGRKTMTRRIIPMTLHRKDKDGTLTEIKPDEMVIVDGGIALFRFGDNCYRVPRENQPAYRIGEEVAVAQSYENIYDDMVKREGKRKANVMWAGFCSIFGEGVDPVFTSGYRNKLFVRADLMPHRIRITNIKVERLQDINEEDALREGVYHYEQPPLHHKMDPFAPWPPYAKPFKRNCDNLKFRFTARAAFAYLIDKVCRSGIWKKNPWVYAYEFELIK